jgi:hypothetical protein
MTAALVDDFPPPDRLVTLANWAQGAVQCQGISQRPPADPTAEIAASGRVTAPEMSLIVRMASQATPHDPDRVRGWRRGFDAIAGHFL